MSALLRQVALVSESSSVRFAEVARVSAALQKQVTRDLVRIWEINATVDAFERLEDVPLGYWPVVIKDNIGYDAAGIHLDKDGQPYSLVTSGPDWSLTASHEVIEMLVDPFGNRVIAGDSPKPDQGRVEFLVEACDPSEASEFGYKVNGILVSDFYTPQFFDPVAAPGVRYSFTGAIIEPRQVLTGGYLSWHDLVTDEWWQLTYFGGARKFRNLGKMTSSRSIRSQIDHLTEKYAAVARASGRESITAARGAEAFFESPAAHKAASLRTQIEQLVGKSSSASRPDTTASSEVRRPRRFGKGE